MNWGLWSLTMEMKKNKSHMLLILNPDIIKDLRSYPLGDYSNKAPMTLSYKRYGM